MEHVGIAIANEEHVLIAWHSVDCKQEACRRNHYGTTLGSRDNAYGARHRSVCRDALSAFFLGEGWKSIFTGLQSKRRRGCGVPRFLATDTLQLEPANLLIMLEQVSQRVNAQPALVRSIVNTRIDHEGETTERSPT